MEDYRKKVVIRTWAYTLTSVAFFFPANFLPMMITGELGGYKSNTIFSGVVYFFLNEDYFVAIVIFLASIMIPIIKIAGIVYLLLILHFERKDLRVSAVKIYQILHLIGKWSMLDVFVVVLMVSLVQFGFIAFAKPGPAVIPFALVVIFTVLATKSFDTKLFWSEK